MLPHPTLGQWTGDLKDMMCGCEWLPWHWVFSVSRFNCLRTDILLFSSFVDLSSISTAEEQNKGAMKQHWPETIPPLCQAPCTLHAVTVQTRTLSGKGDLTPCFWQRQISLRTFYWTAGRIKAESPMEILQHGCMLGTRCQSFPGIYGLLETMHFHFICILLFYDDYYSAVAWMPPRRGSFS